MIKFEMRSSKYGVKFAGMLSALGAVLLACAAVFGAEATAPSASVTAPDTADPVGRIEAHYRALTDLQATVVQKNYLKPVDKTQTFDGVLFIKRPGKLRLEYTNGQVIVIDGKEAWFYSRKSEQAIRRTFKDFEQANIPVAFLLGAADMRREFEISFPDAAKPLTLDLKPKKKGAAMKKIEIDADQTGSILRMMIYDRSENTSEILFKDIREGVGVDDKLFRFKVPKGTEVIEQ
ncbi:MAG: outer membrane lipoprotein chaperone LolA [Nitrospiraceae bacterium]|nr:outer membrane lipoprotein chaperone LolA [Nitrospiraceae bacterium]